MSRQILIFIPTFNESGNVTRMYEELVALNLDADIIFLDDNSPDGTGKVLDEIAAGHNRVSVVHRGGKLGIGSAHQEGIARAYDGNYEILVTLDCDFTHLPTEIPNLLAEIESTDVVVGSRFVRADSLRSWPEHRRLLTRVGHFLTRRLLDMPQDASSAFRAYNLKRIPRKIFSQVKSLGYSFFFESLFILKRDGFVIKEVETSFSTRTHGNSKLSFREALRSTRQLLRLYFETPGKSRVEIRNDRELL